MAQLFPYLPFHENETPASWAARLSILHGCPSARTFLSDQGIAPSDLLHGRRAVIDRRCRVAGQDAEAVWRNTASSTGYQSFVLRDERLPASMMVREETRFCPLCLLEDDFRDDNPGIARQDRLSWSLRVVTTCPTHRLALIHRARDHRDNMRHKLLVHVPERAEALLDLARTGLHREPSPLQSYVLDRLDGRKGPEWLDGQTLEQAVKATQMRGIVMAFGTSFNLGSIDRDGWDLAGRSGWQWTSAGKAGLHSAFDTLHVSAMDRGQCGQNYATVFGQLHRWLLEPGDRVPRRHKYSIQSLALEAGVHRQTLRKVLVERRLITHNDTGKSNSILLVDVKQGQDAAAALNRSVPFVTLPARMNATRPVVSCLIELGYLAPLFRSQGENKRDKCGFDSREVDFVLDRLHDLAPEMPHLPVDWVTLMRCTKRARIPMRDLLQRISSGEVKNIGRAEGDQGFNSLRIDI